MQRKSPVRYLLWFLLALPIAMVALAYATERLFYGEVVHLSGEWATRLLMLAMSATPLTLMFPGRPLPRFLMRYRRAFGVASFAWAVLHTVVYLERQTGLADVTDDALDVAYATGWVALAIFLALAATSNDRSVRWLKRGWSRLHRFVYAAAVLTFLHWLLVSFDPVPGLIHAAILAALELYRVVRQRQIRRAADERP